MSKFTDYFEKTHVVLPVIHVADYDEGLLNVALAKECGTDGVFIISHGKVENKDLIQYQKRYIEYTGWSRIGINCLGMSLHDMIVHGNKGAMGVWSDNADINEHGYNYDILNLKNLFDSQNMGLYFGGVAFKYQPQPFDLSQLTSIANEYVDVITTSGDGTGQAADITKIRTMHNAARGFPIGIASGITPENIVDYVPISNAYLVATGIGKDFTNLDSEKLIKLVNSVEKLSKTVV